MSLVENLLRAQRRQCDERRRYLAELEELATRLRTDALRLRAAIDGGADDRLAADGVVLRHAKIERSIAVIETQIGAAAALAVAEGELLQSEHTVAQRGGTGEPVDTRRRRRGRRRDQAELPSGGSGRAG